MGSMYAKIRASETMANTNTNRLCDFDETDPYWFVIRENRKTIAEGELASVKLKLNDSYLRKKIKSFTRDRGIMTAIIDY